MLKDKWKDLQDAVEGILGSGDDISAEHLNLIANELIKSQSDIEKNKTNKANKSDVIGEQLFYDEIDTKYSPGDENIPLVMTYDERNKDNPNEYYENAPFSYCAIITVSQGVFYGDMENINYTSYQIAYNGDSMKVRRASTDGTGTFEGESWTDVTPTKVSQLSNDLGYTTESKVKEMIEELPPVLWGADIDTKYTVDEFIPPLMVYVSDMLDDVGSVTGEQYANAPYMGAGIVVSRAYDDGEYRQVHQVAFSDEGVMVVREVYEEQKFADISWSNDLIPKKTSQLVNDKEYTTKKDVEDVIKETKAEANQIYANALKGSVSDTIAILDDVSPVPHKVKVSTDASVNSVTVKGANLFDVHSASLVSSNNTCIVEAVEEGHIKVTNRKTGNPQYGRVSIPLPISSPKTVYVKFSARVSDTEISNPIINVGYRNSASSGTINKTESTGITTEWKEYAVSVSVTSDAINKFDELMLLVYTKQGSASMNNVGVYVEVKDIMISTYDSKYIPYESSTHDVKNGVCEVDSIYPSMSISTDVADAVIKADYNRDINKAFEQLQQAIISLGGNV